MGGTPQKLAIEKQDKFKKSIDNKSKYIPKESKAKELYKNK